MSTVNPVQFREAFNDPIGSLDLLATSNPNCVFCWFSRIVVPTAELIIDGILLIIAFDTLPPFNVAVVAIRAMLDTALTAAFDKLGSISNATFPE